MPDSTPHSTPLSVPPSPTAPARNYPPSLVDLAASFRADPASVKPDLLVNQQGLKVLHLNLGPGQRMATHDHVGCHVTVQCLVGTAAVQLDGVTVRVETGQLLSFAGESQVSPGNDSEADCAVLITLVER